MIGLPTRHSRQLRRLVSEAWPDARVPRSAWTRRTTAARRTESDALDRALELEATGKNRVVHGLAPVASNRGQLDGTVDLDVERPVAVQRNELRGELDVQPGSDLGGDAPLQDGQPVTVGNAERRSGSCPMVGMTGDATGFEREERHRVARIAFDDRINGVCRNGTEATVAEVVEHDITDTKSRRSSGQLPKPNCDEIIGRAERARLPPGQAENAYVAAAGNEIGDHCAQPEALVVGVRDHRQYWSTTDKVAQQRGGARRHGVSGSANS